VVKCCFFNGNLAMELVLDLCKEVSGSFRVGVVIDTGGKNIEHLAPEDFFRGTDVSDALEQFFEIP
jgi:hypothetical protein